MLQSLITTLVLAAAIPKSLAIPPPSFGFPEAPNDTALYIRFQHGNPSITTVVQEAALYGINITATEPTLALNKSAYQSLSSYQGRYCILMVDPDAPYPENPSKRFILHWLQPNMTQTGSDPPQASLSNSTPALVPYRRPSPPTNSSAHRYILYAFEQPGHFSIPPMWRGLGDANRTGFNLTRFVADAGLGSAPAAANYFYVSHRTGVAGEFVAAPGGSYPGGDGTAVTSGDPYRPTAAAAASASAGGGSGSGESSSSSAGAAMFTGVGSLVGAGIVGLAALL